MPVIDHIPAVRGKLEPRKIYPVTEEELRILERGTNGSLYLNFALVFLTTAIGTSINWLTSSEVSIVTVGIMAGITFVGYTIGIMLLIIWRRAGGDHKEILEKIRARIEAEKRAEEAELEIVTKKEVLTLINQ